SLRTVLVAALALPRLHDQVIVQTVEPGSGADERAQDQEQRHRPQPAVDEPTQEQEEQRPERPLQAEAHVAPRIHDRWGLPRPSLAPPCHPALLCRSTDRPPSYELVKIFASAPRSHDTMRSFDPRTHGKTYVL